MSGMGGPERPAAGPWPRGPGRPRRRAGSVAAPGPRRAGAPWLRMARVASLSCAALLSCAVVPGGEGPPPDSAAAVYLKAPDAAAGDYFGDAVALSADGSTLAVGAPGQGSSPPGADAPGGEGYRDVLDGPDVIYNGAVYIHRRSATGRWAIEAIVKAPVAGAKFGDALALSADGSVLAVGAPGQGISPPGASALGGGGYRDVLDGPDVIYNGAVYIHHRSATGRWALGAIVKAPVADAGDRFGSALALSADGATLAVGAPGEDSAATGAFAPGDPSYQAALDDNSVHNVSRYNLDHDPNDPDSDEFLETEVGIDAGTAYVYRRSGADGLWILEAFVKAPKADADDLFGGALALSADGATLAVRAFDDSASVGTFDPGGKGYQTALDSEASTDSGAVTVYRRSESDDWEIEAFVKAPVAGRFGYFGFALALSADGATLAVGTRWEGSAATGAFAPDAPGYQAALESDGARYSGAVTVHRRSAAGRWAIEAFVKAPNAEARDAFGSAIALSADGAALAVGARWEDSSATGAFAPDAPGYQAALESAGAFNSGAVYVHHRSAAARWTLEAFVKAPNAGAGDQFGSALALSADGSALAVGAPEEDGRARPRPGTGGSAGAGNAVGASGAAYLY